MLQTGLAAVAGLILCPSQSAAGAGTLCGAHEKVGQILGVLLHVGTTARAPLCPFTRMCDAEPVTPVTTVLPVQMRHLRQGQVFDVGRVAVL